MVEELQELENSRHKFAEDKLTTCFNRLVITCVIALATAIGLVIGSFGNKSQYEQEQYHDQFWREIDADQPAADPLARHIQSQLSGASDGDISISPAMEINNEHQLLISTYFQPAANAYYATDAFFEALQAQEQFGLAAVKVEEPIRKPLARSVLVSLIGVPLVGLALSILGNVHKVKLAELVYARRFERTHKKLTQKRREALWSHPELNQWVIRLESAIKTAKQTGASQRSIDNLQNNLDCINKLVDARVQQQVAEENRHSVHATDLDSEHEQFMQEAMADLPDPAEEMINQVIEDFAAEFEQSSAIK